MVVLVMGALLFNTASNAFAENLIYITPVEGSKIPGCQETESGCFSPTIISAEVNSTVIFKNTDTSAHTFTSVDGYFDTQLMINDGTEYEWSVISGKTDYVCLLHPWAQGSIIGVTAPTIDTLIAYPDWVDNIFTWYDDGLIDYDTLINALTYLMNNGIVE
jgi:plastocyanin